jgi:hypothetical protein
MTEHDPALVEKVAEVIAFDIDEPMWSAVVIAKHVLDAVASDISEWESSEGSDVAGCPAATDYQVKGGPVLLTRCTRRAGHAGQHNNPRTKRWPDSQTTWLLTPPPRADRIEGGGHE